MKRRAQIRNAVFVVFAVVAIAVASVWTKRALHAGLAHNAARKDLEAKNLALIEQIRQIGVVRTATALGADPAQSDEVRNAREERRRKLRESAQSRVKALNERLENDRVFAINYYAEKRADVDINYGPFLHSIRVTAAQRDAIAEALFARDMRIDLLMGRVRVGEVVPDGAASREARETANNELRESVAAIAGEDTAQAFDRYERARPAWNSVNLLATELALTTSPLSLEQAANLASAIAEGSEPYRNGDKMLAHKIDWESVDAKARAFLDDTQFEYFSKAQTMVPGGVARQQDEFTQAIDSLREKVKSE
ncbi:hypothetical protein M2103_002358 [Ereboglobus sp. PH5-5]|uniref:hypothetical protein n=1 Tax=Ereboglobus sp. PH5-5 TaxID=2940529 RepID=UPI0024067DC6|nr:hypothetical protein [Ereboglobus sp. PH5-5]MDF9834121.1 hypothetical protein [Ereboglobus sp. PH5-5]